ncbi:MAG: gliding motility-associated C-terminal domain-containing protein [Bacteroidetes bacterium]|nr:gliding motility-associated C-terminal domain-containing protein [Bacteroidota bacterium]
MRSAFLILNFYCLTLFSQVGPPDLRCIQVAPNGNVTLTWIPPSDPGGLFDSYDIYSSITSSGPFVVVGNVNTINTTTFTHASSNATVASVYYYVRTKFNPSGTSVSVPSDTLRSIFLNIINTAGAPDVKLVYNNIHQPKLPTSGSNFSILKEFPAATWSNFATTPALSYADTISVCSASLNYQVTLPDNSGCISSSNVQGGVFTDKKNPNQPYVDSISVLPNGNVVLAWYIPRDLDIIKYIIVKNIGGVYTKIDSVIGRNNTIYTFTTTEANSNAVQIYVFAVDSCGNPGSYDVLPTTMFLKATYDRCAYKTNLTWNAYVNIPKGILEYRIYASVNNSPFLKIGNTTQTNFTVDNVPPNSNVCYFVRVVNSNQSITASSNRTCIFSKQVPASNFVYIKKASIKDRYSAEVTMYLDTTKTSQGLDLYRSTDGVNFNVITFIPYSGRANFYFLDEKIDADTTSYYYKAVVKDSCGNSRTYSNIAKTILLKVKDDDENIFTKHLNWNDYLGFAGGVSGYNIYRVINDVQSSSPVASTGPTINNFTDNLEDEAPNGSKIEYLIEAVEGIGNPYGFLEAGKSNAAAIYMEGKIFVPTAFAPKGKNKIWLPVTHFVDKSEYTVTVFNRWGNKVFETNDDTKGWDGNGNPNDVYVYLITYKNARGEYLELKGTVFLLD